MVGIEQGYQGGSQLGLHCKRRQGTTHSKFGLAAALPSTWQYVGADGLMVGIEQGYQGGSQLGLHFKQRQEQVCVGTSSRFGSMV
jgi:hypothetical protein